MKQESQQNQQMEIEEDIQQQEQIQFLSKNKKTFMPQTYHKAKRNITKMVNQFFLKLKQEINRGACIFVNSCKLDDIMAALMSYVSVRYEKRQLFQMALKINQDKNKKNNKLGAFGYISQSEKIVNCTPDGKINTINITKNNYKLPDSATPVPFNNSIYLLDPSNFNKKSKTFAPQGPAFIINNQGILKQTKPPLYFRMKCAIVKDNQFIYLLGGYASQKKILTNKCQKYRPLTEQSFQMPDMNNKHVCPSACILNKNIWVFSSNYIQFFEYQKWVNISLPFGCMFRPFQYTFPINERQILMFGGSFWNKKSQQVKIFDTQKLCMNYYGDILPQGICNERNWGPTIISGCVAVLSSLQASIYPQTAVKSQMIQVIYLHQQSTHLNNIVNFQKI